MYTRRQSGLSATTDQAIIAGRPLLISANDTFRHIHPYILPYPRTTLRGALEHSLPGVYAMQGDWSRRAFGEAFLAMLRAYGVLEAPKVHETRPVYAAVDRSRTRILLGLPSGETASNLLDWSERVTQAIGKSVLIDVTAVPLRSVAAVRAAAFWSAGDGLVVVQERAELEPEIENTLQAMAAQGLRILRVCRDAEDSKAATQPWAALGPVIPFFTSLLPPPEGAPVINCYGFESGTLLPEVVGKIQRELGIAVIRIHVTPKLSDAAFAQLEQRLAFLRALLLPTSGVTVELSTFDRDIAALMASLGTAGLNVFSGGAKNLAVVQNVLDLAMAVGRPVCHTSAEPMPSYGEKLPFLEAQSIQTLVREGVALLAPAYNLYSEGRALLELEQLLDVVPTPPRHRGPLSRAADRKIALGALLVIEPNGIIGEAEKEALSASFTAAKTKLETLDQRYRPASMVQQQFLLEASQAVQTRWRDGRVLLVGDPQRYAVAVLDASGGKFDLCDSVTSVRRERDRYHLIMLVNIVSGRDELELALELFQHNLVPAGLGILTFFHCDSYNVGAADLNPDFPMLTEYDLNDALGRRSGLLAPVTEPRWRSDRPMLCIDPFAMPPFGTLVVTRTASNASGGYG